MFNPDVKAKMVDSLKGRAPKSRGGNGNLSEPQMALLAALGDGWVVELAINTRDVRHLFDRPSNHYKADIANAALKIAVELDGFSHNSPKARALDAKKEAILSALGWKVFRFSNQQILSDMGSVTTLLKSSTT